MLNANPQQTAAQRKKQRKRLRIAKASDAERALQLQTEQANALEALEQQRTARRTQQAAAKAAKATADEKALLEQLGVEGYRQYIWQQYEDTDQGWGDRPSDHAWDAENNAENSEENSEFDLGGGFDAETQSLREPEHSDDPNDSGISENKDLSDLDSPNPIGPKLLEHGAFKTPRNRKNRKKSHIARASAQR